MTLTEFLNARLDETEAAARLVRDWPSVVDAVTNPRVTEHLVHHSPDRALAEVDAKRRIIALAYEATGLDMDRDLDRAVDAREKSGIEFVGERLLRTIAQPYADHPDYDESWRP